MRVTKRLLPLSALGLFNDVLKIDHRQSFSSKLYALDSITNVRNRKPLGRRSCSFRNPLLYYSLAGELFVPLPSGPIPLQLHQTCWKDYLSACVALFLFSLSTSIPLSNRFPRSVSRLIRCPLFKRLNYLAGPYRWSGMPLVMVFLSSPTGRASLLSWKFGFSFFLIQVFDPSMFQQAVLRWAACCFRNHETNVIRKHPSSGSIPRQGTALAALAAGNLPPSFLREIKIFCLFWPHKDWQDLV